MAVTPRRKYSPRLPREQRREQLLDATLALIAAEGFGAVSMEAVARRADIAKTVVYDAFGNRQSLLEALFKREQARVYAGIAAALPQLPLDGEPLGILSSSIRRLLERAHDHPDTWRLILLPADGTPPALRDAVDRHRRELLGRVEPLVVWGLGRLGAGHVDAELATQTVIAMAEHAVRLTLTDPERFPADRVASFARDALDVIAPPRG